MAFVDVRMPPGWDGIETIQRIWKADPDLQVVICTAYSDHSWEEIIQKLGATDSLLILKKPFDNVEVLQLAHSLSKKWVVTNQARFRLENLEAMVDARTAELTRANEQLTSEIKRRAEVEIELRESEERFRKSFEAALVSLAMMRADTLAHTDVNSSFLSLIGRSREEVIGRTPQELGFVENPEAFEQMLKILRLGKPVHNVEIPLRGADGRRRQTLVSIVPLQLGRQACLLAAVLDITEQRRLESEMRQSQKMEAVGQLAAGVAHDFNNLLTVIIGHASIQLAQAGIEKELGKSLEEVNKAAERAAALTRQLLAFSRKQVLRRACLDVVGTVANMQDMLARLVGETVEIKMDFGENVPCILGDEANIEQVLLNLVVNARDAMPKGGTLRVRVESRELLVPVTGHPDARPGRFVVISAQDTGCGMDAETQQRIFEPFFTTKPSGTGTGLGLSTVYGIVKQHEGWIEVQSRPGAGTTFRVYLPATAESVSNRESADHRPRVAANNECILVVEDEPQVRSYVCETLHHHGYTVLDADCGPAAIEAWEKAPRPVDLLLTDMVMPNGISGGSLAKTLLERSGDLKVIYMSGYSPEILNNPEMPNGIRNFLPKPFTADNLLDIVGATIQPAAQVESAA
jgi:PAS domain S-box-containing protein